MASGGIFWKGVGEDVCFFFPVVLCCRKNILLEHCHPLIMVNLALGQLEVRKILLFISLEIELHPQSFKSIIPCICSHLKPA